MEIINAEKKVYCFPIWHYSSMKIMHGTVYYTIHFSSVRSRVCVRERNNQQADHSCTSFSPYRSFVYVISARSAIYTQSLAIAAMAPCCCENICYSIHPQYYSSLERPNFAQQQQRPNPAGRRMCSRSCTKYQQPIVIRGGSSLPFLFAKKTSSLPFSKENANEKTSGTKLIWGRGRRYVLDTTN